MPSRTTITGRRLLATGRAMRSSRFSTQSSRRSRCLPRSTPRACGRRRHPGRHAVAAPAPTAPHRRRQVAAPGRCRRGRAAPGRGQPSPRSGASGSRRRPASRVAPPARRASGPAGRILSGADLGIPVAPAAMGLDPLERFFDRGERHACRVRQDPAQLSSQRGELASRPASRTRLRPARLRVPSASPPSSADNRSARSHSSRRLERVPVVGPPGDQGFGRFAERLSAAWAGARPPR